MNLHVFPVKISSKASGSKGLHRGYAAMDHMVAFMAMEKAQEVIANARRSERQGESNPLDHATQANVGSVASTLMASENDVQRWLSNAFILEATVHSSIALV